MTSKQPSTTNNQPPTIRLEQNDCLTFLRSLPNDCVDVIVTDPAYSGMNEWLQLGNGRIVGQYADKGTENGKWFQEFPDSVENFNQFLTQCRRVLNPDTGHIYIMFDSYSLLSLGPIMRDYFSVKNLITWDKVNIGMGHYFRRRHEYIIFATNGNNRKLRHQGFPDVWRFKRLHRAPYATQKPVELFQAMIHASAEPGFTICDPFMGSGSSVIAALKNGCHYLGCDIADEAVNITQKRVTAFQDTGQDILQLKPAYLAGEKLFWE